MTLIYVHLEAMSCPKKFQGKIHKQKIILIRFINNSETNSCGIIYCCKHCN